MLNKKSINYFDFFGMGFIDSDLSVSQTVTFMVKYYFFGINLELK
mgnify:CR=1 FL=1